MADVVKLVSRREIRPSTGDLAHPGYVAGIRDSLLPATMVAAREMVILDLSGKLLTPASLAELVVPIGQRVRGGAYGDLRIVVVTSDRHVRMMIGLLAREHGFPMFVADSMEDVDRAEPVGDLTRGEAETFDDLGKFGGMVTIANYAKASGLETTAANNRLVNLERKGFVFRVHRPRTEGDLFVDPRIDTETTLAEVSPTAVLQSAGIGFDPHDTSTLVLTGDEAARVRALLANRQKDADRS